MPAASWAGADQGRSLARYITAEWAELGQPRSARAVDDALACAQRLVAAHDDPRERSRWLARRCGLDETAIWEWGVVERVSTGLLATRIELQPVGRQMLAAADQVAG